MNAMAVRQNKNEKNLHPLHWYDIRWQGSLAIIHDRAGINYQITGDEYEYRANCDIAFSFIIYGGVKAI